MKVMDSNLFCFFIKTPLRPFYVLCEVLCGSSLDLPIIRLFTLSFVAFPSLVVSFSWNSCHPPDVPSRLLVPPSPYPSRTHFRHV